MKTESSNDPCVHVRNLKQEISALVSHLRHDAEQVEEPKAQALFETGAEVLLGLRTALEHYEQGAEKALR